MVLGQWWRKGLYNQLFYNKLADYCFATYEPIENKFSKKFEKLEAEICECESDLNEDNDSINLKDWLGYLKKDIEHVMDEKLCLITKMPSINKGVFNNLLIK